VADEEWGGPRHGDLGPEHTTRRSIRRAPMPARRAGPPSVRRPGPLPGQSRARVPLPSLSPSPAEFTSPTEVIEPDVPVVPRVSASGRPVRRRPTGRRVAAITGYAVLGLVSLVVLGLTGYSWGS
jgi:hypothetical protein